jgi:oligopeptide/dipeptide ABC transporter ATP-binding protein
MDYEVKRLPVIPGHVLSPEESVRGCRFHPRCAYAGDVCRARVPEITERGGRRVRCHTFAEQG